MKPSLRVAVLAVFASVTFAAAVLPAGKPEKTPFWGGPRSKVPPVAATAAATPGDGEVFGKLNNTWWKLKVKARGTSVEAGTLAAEPATFKTTAYMYLFLEKPAASDGGDGLTGVQYSYLIYTQPTPEDDWGNSFDGSFVVTGVDDHGNEAVAFNNIMAFFANGGVVGGSHSGRLTLKVSDGELKSGKLKSLGCEVFDSTLDFTNFFFGGMEVSGETVPVSKLPFQIV